MIGLGFPRARVEVLVTILCVCALFAPSAHAGDFVPGIRVQTGANISRSPVANGKIDDLFVAATPELSYLFGTERTLFSATYAFTGSLNLQTPNGIANALGVVAAHDLTPATQLLFGLGAVQSTFGNLLLVRSTTQTQLGAAPPLNTQLVTFNVSQAVLHEISPVVRLTEAVTASDTLTLDDDRKVVGQSYLGSLSLALDRAWQFDALGVDARGQFARSDGGNLTSNTITVALGPRYQRDFGPTLSGSIVAAGALAVSPDPGTKARVTPAGRLTLNYFSEGSGLDLTLSAGFDPNPVLGTLFESQQGTLRGYTTLSDANRIVMGVSVGWLHGKTLDLRDTGALDNAFDAVLHDADLTWSPSDYLQVFARYQFIGQTSGDNAALSPSVIRHSATIGIQAAYRTVERKVPTQFPQRVDQKDRAERPEQLAP